MTLDVSVLVVTWQSSELLPALASALPAVLPGWRWELWIADNASSDGSLALARKFFPQAFLMANEANIGLAKAWNRLWRRARGRYLLFLNPDALPRPGSIAALVRALASHPEAVAAGPLLRLPDGRVDPQGARRFPDFWNEFCDKTGLLSRFPAHPWFGTYWLGGWDHLSSRYVPVLSGAALLVRREALASVGGFDEAFFLYGEETDLCWRWRAHGNRCLYWPEAEVLHGGGASARYLPEAGLVALKSMTHFFDKRWGRSGALGYRLMLAFIFSAKWLLAVVARFSHRRRTYWAAKQSLYRRLLRFAVRGD